MSLSISVIILTYNSERSIEPTLANAQRVSNDLHVVDSFSNDRTIEIVRRFRANLVQHEFDNYATQRNWAIENLPIRGDWELHLDADERLTDDLVRDISSLDEKTTDSIDGFLIPRLMHFLGRPIRHGGMYPIWHLRLFRRGAGCCERRRYDQHFYVRGRTAKLSSPFVDDMRMTLHEWINRHNNWSSAEVEELLSPTTSDVIAPNYRGNEIERRRAWRSLYNRFPLFLRSVMLFTYRYFFRLGFLDGKEGLIFFVLQTFWFRFLVDAKLHEKQITGDSE
jgi:glycosyltransferase involved in cell wall biosynthesis